MKRPALNRLEIFRCPAFPARISLLATVISLVGWIPPAAFAQEQISLSTRTVVLQGDTPPGIDQPLTTFFPPLINENSDVAFIGVAGGLNAVWKEVDGVLQLVVKEGDTAPGTGGDTFDSFEDLVFNDAGTVAFVGVLADADINFSSGIWVENDGALVKVVQRGDLAPIGTDPADRFFDRPFSQDIANVFPFVMNDGGTMAFFSDLRLEDMSPAGTAVFTWADGVLTELDSTRFPGTTTGLTELSNNNTLGNNGVVGVVRRDSTGITATGGLANDDEAPGTDGASFQFFGRPAVNSGGQVVIRVNLLGNSTTPVTVSDDSAIYTTATGLTLVARENDPAPGNNGQFGDMNGDPLINDAGEIVFENFLRNAPSGATWGIWTTTGGGVLRPILVEGDPVPGAEPESVFRFSSALPVARVLVLNDRGNTVFVAQMEGPGITSNNDIALFAEIRGEMGMLLREGDSIRVAPGDVRTVHLLSANDVLGIAGGTGNGDGRRSAFNNQDQLVVPVEFSGGGSGIFVLNDVEIAVAGSSMQPVMSLNPDGHPTIDYTVLPGLEYSIRRYNELLDPGAGITVSPVFSPSQKQRSRFTDDGITIVPGTGPVIGPANSYYLLRYQKLP